MSETTTTTAERVRIIQLRARNVKCLKEVDIDLDGNIHEIRGDAGQGKTAILQTIEAGLRGMDPDMVRNGADESEIELHLSNSTIKRVMSADGKEKLSVKDVNGKTIERAKTFLAALCGKSAFRPLEWATLGGGDAKGRTDRLREQRRQLLEALPLALTQEQVKGAVATLGKKYVEAFSTVPVDAVHWNDHAFTLCQTLAQVTYDYRRFKNAQADAAESTLTNTPAPAEVAPRDSEAELSAALDQAREEYLLAKTQTTGMDRLRAQRDDLAAKIATEDEQLPPKDKLDATRAAYSEKIKTAQTDLQLSHAAIDGIDLEIARLNERKRELEEEIRTVADGIKVNRDKVDQCDALERRMNAQEARRADLERMDAELANSAPSVDMDALQANGERFRHLLDVKRQSNAHLAAYNAALEAREIAKRYDALVDLFRNTIPSELLSLAKLPVEGLSVDDEKILVNGVPLHQLGTSQQIKIGVLIASRMNPDSAFILVDGAESMGRKDRVALAESAQELGLQLIMTVVDPDAKPSPGVTVMQDGEAIN